MVLEAAFFEGPQLKTTLTFWRLTTNKWRRGGFRNLKLYHDLLLPKYKDGTLKITKKKEIKVTYESRKHEKKKQKKMQLTKQTTVP